MVHRFSPHINMENPGKRSRDEFEDAPGDFDGKRQHNDPVLELVSNICKDIRRLGENANLNAQIDDISYISNPIVAEFEKIDKLREAVLSTLYAVVVEQPHKIPNVAVLITVCDAKNFLVAKYVVEYFHTRAQELLALQELQNGAETVAKVAEEHAEVNKGTENANGDDAMAVEGQNGDDAAAKAGNEEIERIFLVPESAGTFNDLKSVFKFLASLNHIIAEGAVFAIFKEALNVATRLQNASEGRNGTAEQLFYNVLIALPYFFSNDFSELSVQQANEIVELATQFPMVETADKPLSVLDPFDSKNGNFEVPYHPKKTINLILPAIQALQGEDKSWSEFRNLLFLNFKDLVDPIMNEALQSNTISNTLVRHLLPQLAFPDIEKLKNYEPKGRIDQLWKNHPRLLFSVYNHNSLVETVPPVETYTGLFFKDLSFDILTNMSFNQKEASIQLCILDLFCNRDLFSPPGSSMDQLTMIATDNRNGENVPPLSTWKIEDVAVESILTMIFQLPQALHYEIYYYTVLISCCRESPESIAPVFGRAIRFFYSNLEMFDYELKIRYMDWMTTQISNFDFSWKWDEWVSDSKLYRNLQFHPKRNFIKNLIAKEVRLSNKSRIKDTFVAMLPQDDGDARLTALDEFYQYLDISLLPNATDFAIDYDYSLYGGNNESLRNTIVSSVQQKIEANRDKPLVSPQEELIYDYSNPLLPLSEVANKLYDFITANWRSNEQFRTMVSETVEAIKSSVVDVDFDRVFVNLLFQTYAYIGSRSIYSVVSILNRDVVKLKYIAGMEVTDADYKQSGNDYKFPDLELGPGDFAKRQDWIVALILRVWVHQPQVAFLILEYLVEFGVLKPEFLIRKALEFDYNLIISNVSCMESINRVLSGRSKGDNFKDEMLLVFTLIAENMNNIVRELNSEKSEVIQITKEFSDEQADDLDLMKKIDLQWLFYEYRGLLKTYLRKFNSELGSFREEIASILQNIQNEPVNHDVTEWIEQLSR